MDRELLKTATDEQLAVAYQESGDGDIFGEILERYEKMAYKVAYTVFRRNDFGLEDIVQEMRTKLISSLRTYDPSKSKLTAHIWRCLNRHAVTLIKYANREMRKANTVSLHQTIPGYDVTYESILQDPQDVEKIGLSEISCREILDERYTLLEKRVVYLISCGYTYADVAKIINVTERSVDNALQRVRRKSA